MVDTFTANYELTQPEVGASDNTWGDKHNANMDAIDTQMKANADAITAARAKGIPTGGILVWSGSVVSIPSGWALCNGLNGTPDLRDRFIIGAQGAHSIGATGGSATTSSDGAHDHSMLGAGSHSHGGSTAAHAITIAEMPSHDHGGGVHTHTEDIRGAQPLATTVRGFAVTTQGQGTRSISSSGAILTAQGSGASHDHSISLASDHSHTINSNGAHTHTLTPSFYALALIMKL